MATAANLTGKSAVRVAVIGDPGTGKSSLVFALATGQFSEEVPTVMPPRPPPRRLFLRWRPHHHRRHLLQVRIPPEQKERLVAECKAADVVVLTYACDRPDTVERLVSFWLPELRQLKLNVPVIVAGCKLDLTQINVDQVTEPIIRLFHDVDTCIECSALRLFQVPEVFYYAHKAVLHPTAPLFDQEAQCLKPRCIRALKRIFFLCDHDRDGALNDMELNDFQFKCFGAPLQPDGISATRRVVQQRMPEGVNEAGLTLIGFLYLNALFIENGGLETAWRVLRKFGYDNEVKLRDDLISVPIIRAPDQTMELTVKAVNFLTGLFNIFDIDNDGVLLPAELEDLFSTAPENPWSSDPYKNCAETNVVSCGLSLNGFLSKWALMTFLDPSKSLANLVYVGYLGDFASAFTTTRKRRDDRKRKQTHRNVFHCYVFGPRGSGKSALLQSFIGRQPSDPLPSSSELFATNTVELTDLLGVFLIQCFIFFLLKETRKILILHEIPEDDVRSLLTNQESLATCDVAVFVYDSSDEVSWQRTRDLLIKVATHGESTGYKVPCLIVAAKDDLDQSPHALQESTRVSQDIGIETPIPVSVESRDLNNVFRRIVHAAQQPHLSIPETEAGRTSRQYRQLLSRSLMVASAGAAIAVVGVTAYRIYAARTNTSS
ncbi:hypothetical protein PR202_ga13204 [Eleusine coracana subsp. coracana]|uniref:Mitochondrial Rho GTPase n=1 Tax=Eleusine coracana subsp. coracana TaxID=191504 RepID=A0AAV5CE81_ELECO|nr:hypothetical protein PR202_ga13204 [Eleusine coracana subsp. coracana]